MRLDKFDDASRHTLKRVKRNFKKFKSFLKKMKSFLMKLLHVLERGPFCFGKQQKRRVLLIIWLLFFYPFYMIPSKSK